MNTNTRRGTTKVTLDLSVVSPTTLLQVQRMARELRLTDQILSIDLDTVEVVQSGPAAAWTSLDGDAITFAWNQMPKQLTDRIDIAVWLGTNAHELGHVLFSPRSSSTLMFRVVESDRTFLPGVKNLHNIVEDQRQERLLLARFSPWTGYLTAALGHHLKVDTRASWMLFAGRTWLPQAVRDQAKQLMIDEFGQHITDEVTRIVGEYQRLTDPGDVECEEAWDLLEALHSLFADAMPQMPNACTIMDGGEPSTDDAGESAPLTADEADADSDGTGGDDSDADTADSDDGEGEGDSDGDSDGDSKADTDSDDESSGTGAGDKPAKPFTKDEARRQLKDAAKAQIENDDAASGDLDSILDALKYGRGADDSEGAEALGRYEEATDAARMLHHDVGDALLDLKDECEPGWLKRTDSGRLNVRRLLTTNADVDTLFDRYEPGMMDTTEMDVVLLLDVSGSMNSATLQLAEATWAIRHAVDDLEGRCAVYTWDSGPHRVLAGPNDRPDGRMFVPLAMGGTNPTTALREALRYIAGSEAKNKLVVVLTDGDWFDDSAASENVIIAMNQLGITTVCGLLGSAAGNSYHQCQFGGVLSTPIDLAHLFRRVAVERVRSWL